MASMFRDESKKKFEDKKDVLDPDRDKKDERGSLLNPINLVTAVPNILPFHKKHDV
jgi:hypothetical protein